MICLLHIKRHDFNTEIIWSKMDVQESFTKRNGYEGRIRNPLLNRDIVLTETYFEEEDCQNKEY